MIEVNQVKVVTKYELMKQSKRKRFYAILILVVVFEVLLVLASSGMTPPGDAYTLGAFLSLTSLGFGVLASIFFSSDAIAGEFEGKTGYILFANPIRHSILIAGKYLACILATLPILAITYGINVLITLNIYGWVPLAPTVESFAYTVLFVGSVIAMTFFFSSMLKGGMGAAIVMLLLLVMGFPIIHGIFVTSVGADPVFLLTRAGMAIPSVYAAAAGIQLPGFISSLIIIDVVDAVGVMILYIAVFLSLSVVITRRREMV
jgi:ABC-2 type transport system permease protein